MHRPSIESSEHSLRVGVSKLAAQHRDGASPRKNAGDLRSAIGEYAIWRGTDSVDRVTLPQRLPLAAAAPILEARGIAL